MPAVLQFDAIVIGAGAAGLMCAIEAGKRGRRVAVIEHADKIGKKILISGGGRCNFTNIHCTPENFLSGNPHFHKSALARYTPADFISLVEKHRIKYHEKTLGQLFCDNSAREIITMLEEECRRSHAQIFTGTSIKAVSRANEFILTTTKQEFRTPALVIASGGLSIPKMGASALGYEVAKQFGLRIRQTRPGLVPLTFTPEDRDRYSDLAGVSAEAIASADEHKFRERILFTHRGLSGPAILQISSYWKPQEAIALDLAPEYLATAQFRDPKARRDLQSAKQALRNFLPQRLADRWVDNNPPTAWTNQAFEEWERKLHRWTIIPAGTEGYDKAEVTAGGVDTDELSSKTMESKKIPGLYFIGEVVDVTGHLGGFNFQWAWASGYCAGQAI